MHHPREEVRASGVGRGVGSEIGVSASDVHGEGPPGAVSLRRLLKFNLATVYIPMAYILMKRGVIRYGKLFFFVAVGIRTFSLFGVWMCITERGMSMMIIRRVGGLVFLFVECRSHRVFLFFGVLGGVRESFRYHAEVGFFWCSCFLCLFIPS